MSDDKKRRKKTTEESENSSVPQKEIGEIEQGVDEYLYEETRKKSGVRSRKKQLKKTTARTVSRVKKSAAITSSDTASRTDEEPETQRNNESIRKKTVKKKKLSLQTRIAIAAAKTVFVYIPLTVITLVFAVLIILKAVLQPSFVQNLAVKNFNKTADGSLSLDVRKFDPYRGFIIENIIIKDSPDFGGDECVTIDKLVFDYSFFSVFTGNVRINEIGIYSPKISVEQKNGEFNLLKLMKTKPAAEKKPEEKKKEEKKSEKDKEKEKPEKEPMTEISLPINISLLFKFVLSDLSVSFTGDGMKGHLNDFSMSADIDIPPCRKIPLSPEAVKLIRLLDIKINPGEKLDAGFYSDMISVAPPLVFAFNLFYTGENNNTRFNSNFKAGTSNTAVRFQNTALDPLSVSIDYRLFYNPVTDYLNLETFGVSFAGDRWLNVAGTVDKPVTEQKIDMAITESNIDLNKAFPYVKAILNALSVELPLQLGGNISLAPLKVSGTPKDIIADGAVILENILLSMPGFELDLPLFALNYGINYKESGVFADTKINAPGLRYTLGRDRSGRNNLSLDLTASSTEGFSHHKVNNLNFKLTDPVSRLDALDLAMRVDARTGDAIKTSVNIDRLVFRNQPLQNMTPSALSKQLKGIPLKKPVTLDLSTNAEVVGQKQNVTLDLGLKVPDYDVYDMRLSTAVRNNMELKRADIDRFRLSSGAYGLNFTIDGFADYSEAPLKDSDLNVRLAVRQSDFKDMYGGWNLKGLLSLNARMRGNHKNGAVKGNIFIKDLSVEHKDKENPDAKVLSLSEMNLDFPYEYRFTEEYTGLSKIARDKSKLISNDNFKEKRNLTIGSVKIAHPARPKQYLEVVSGMDGTMYFRNNSFDIVNLQASVLGGSLSMKDTLFYLADFSLDNMEYSLGMDVVNLNIGRLDNPNSTETEAFLSMTSTISGKGLNIKKSISPKGNINVYKVGNKLAGKLLQGLKDEKGRSRMGMTQDVVNSSMRVGGFDFYMDNGNVYTTVKLRRELLVRASGFKIENDEIKYDRIPIQEFLRKVREE